MMGNDESNSSSCRTHSPEEEYAGPMKTRTSDYFFMLCLALYSTITASTPALATTDTYAGAETCAACHRNIYDGYRQSGHPYKIQKVTGGPPAYPPGTSPGIPMPPKGMDWDDISYVIGGYGWKARFMDREGYILTGDADRQYNLANENLGTQPHWIGYGSGEASRKPYTCGTCHSTGWKASGKDGPHQDGLPGIYGTWASPGVTCEACHGPGAAHAASPATAKLTVEPNCKMCHVRGDETSIDASGGLVRHHEQYEDLLASPHRTLGCMACHDSHLGTRYGRGGFKGQAGTCVQCHQNQARAIVAPEPHRACTDCHMPYAAKTAVSSRVEYQDGFVPKGDLRSHIFRISPDPGWNMFTDDGRFVRTDAENRAYLALDYTCLSCHTGKNKAWATKNAKRIHAQK